MADDHALLTLDLPQRAGAAGAARKALTALNGSLQLVSQARLHDAQLLISELVASAVRHGGGPDEPISIVVRATPRVLHVEVRDHGRDFERAQLDALLCDRVGRWGLQIITTLAARWRVERDSATVWFEIDRPQQQTAPQSPLQPWDT
jgi:anti-sigma regulatory factor (Ser/Thr protein kinase)